MTYIVTTPFKNSRGEIILPGNRIDLTTDQAASMKNFVRPTATPEQARELMTEIAGRDPGNGCWSWVKINKPGLWRAHMKALLDDDITAARLSFNGMLHAWANRHQGTQGELL